MVVVSDRLGGVGKGEGTCVLVVVEMCTCMVS